MQTHLGLQQLTNLRKRLLILTTEPEERYNSTQRQQQPFSQHVSVRVACLGRPTCDQLKKPEAKVFPTCHQRQHRNHISARTILASGPHQCQGHTSARATSAPGPYQHQGHTSSRATLEPGPYEHHSIPASPHTSVILTTALSGTDYYNVRVNRGYEGYYNYDQGTAKRGNQ